jgi:hypothetical protein
MLPNSFTRRRRVILVAAVISSAILIVGGVAWVIVKSRSDALVSVGGALHVDGERQVRMRWAMDGHDRVRVILLDYGDPGLDRDGVIVKTHYPPSREGSGLWVHGKRVELRDQTILVVQTRHADHAIEIRSIGQEDVEALMEGTRAAIERTLEGGMMVSDTVTVDKRGERR